MDGGYLVDVAMARQQDEAVKGARLVVLYGTWIGDDDARLGIKTVSEVCERQPRGRKDGSRSLYGRGRCNVEKSGRETEDLTGTEDGCRARLEAV